MLILNATPERPTTEQLVIKLSVQAVVGGQWQIDLDLAEGLPLQKLAQPRLIVKDGEVGRIEVGDPERRRLSPELTARRAAPGRT